MKNDERRKTQERNFRRMYSLERQDATAIAEKAFRDPAYNIKPLSKNAQALLRK